MTAHSTISSFPSPRVFQTAFSSSDLPVMVTRVPPPVMAFPSGPIFLEICPNCIRLGGMRSNLLKSGYKILKAGTGCSNARPA